METCEHCAAIAGILAALLPVAIKAAHALGYELPFLSWLADFVAARKGQ